MTSIPSECTSKFAFILVEILRQFLSFIVTQIIMDILYTIVQIELDNI